MLGVDYVALAFRNLVAKAKGLTNSLLGGNETVFQ
jgi:hypothetical protein